MMEAINSSLPLVLSLSVLTLLCAFALGVDALLDTHRKESPSRYQPPGQGRDLGGRDIESRLNNDNKKQYINY